MRGARTAVQHDQRQTPLVALAERFVPRAKVAKRRVAAAAAHSGAGLTSVVRPSLATTVPEELPERLPRSRNVTTIT